uniref:MYB family transcription factor n=1 Tax=Melilotus albus TaxID=47082 RepID=A0A896WCY8_MELAB|nr:MYB family transcription factor [Melilotus albus]
MHQRQWLLKPWTRNEHKAFLKGLKAVGKGKWKNISKNFVKTKTPTQVASHAQKHFNHRHGSYNKKNRTSVFDMKLDENDNL